MTKQQKIISFEAKPPPPPGLPSVQQRTKSLQLASRCHSSEIKSSTPPMTSSAAATSTEQREHRSRSKRKNKVKDAKLEHDYQKLFLPPLTNPSVQDTSKGIPTMIDISTVPTMIEVSTMVKDSTSDDDDGSMGAEWPHTTESSIFRGNEGTLGLAPTSIETKNKPKISNMHIADAEEKRTPARTDGRHIQESSGPRFFRRFRRTLHQGTTKNEPSNQK